jgi:hypothetical protein
MKHGSTELLVRAAQPPAVPTNETRIHWIFFFHPWLESSASSVQPAREESGAGTRRTPKRFARNGFVELPA